MVHGGDHARACTGAIHATGPADPRVGPDRMPQCGRCRGIWPLTRSQEEELPGNLADESDASVSDLRETRRFEDNVKTERRRYDNRRSSASSTHTLTVIYTIERAAVVESSRAFVVGGNASVKIPVAGSVAAKIDASISKRYSVTDQATITMSDTLTVNVPARAAVDVILRWIRIWQEGEALVTESSSDAQLVVPFRVPAALRLDTETVEV
jgi:hypothetical protein